MANFQEVNDVQPFSLNTWTEDVRPIAQYSLSNTRVQIPLKLQPYETTVISFMPSTRKRPPWVTKTTDNIEAVGYTTSGRLFASLKGPSMITVRGTTERSLNFSVPPSTSLNLWDLEIQDWRGNPNYTTSIEAQISVHKLSNQSLLPWKDISPELKSVSGIGTYSTNFTIPNVKDIGAYLSVSPIFNTLHAWVNGHQLSPFAADNAKMDISKYIRRGKINNIKVEVSTTLYNRLRAEMNATLLMGYPLSLMAPSYASAGNQPFGLLGPMVID